MKQTDFKSVEVGGNAEFEGVEATIDLNNLGFVFDIVSKQMYRKPISSIVREITSNCFDSHIEAKVDDAVLVEMGEDDGGEFIAFNDFGVGISPQRMKDVYSVYFKSTKRNSNGEIGFFGLGSKSPLAYTDCFYLNTVFEKVRYEYIVYRGEKCPRIELVIQKPSEERNGSQVKIYLESGDWGEFEAACREQLLYFDNVFFKGVSTSNGYKIVEGEHFKWRDDCDLQYMHICMGKVMYPIDFAQLGMDNIKMPIALKFNIGDLCITPERESVRYIKFKNEEGEWVETNDLIKQKIQLLKEELEAKMSEQAVECYDLHEYVNMLDTSGFSLKMTEDKIFKLGRNMWKGLAIPVPTYVPLAHLSFFKLPRNPVNLIVSVDCILNPYGGHVKPTPTFNTTDIYVGSFKNCLVVRTSHTLVEKQDRKKMLYYKDLAKKQNKESIVFIKQRKYEHKRDLYNAVRSPITAYYKKYATSSGNKQIDLEKYNILSVYKQFKDEVLKYVFQNSIAYSADIDPEWLQAYKDDLKAKRVVIQKKAEEIKIEDYSIVSKTFRGKLINPAVELKGFTGFLIYGFKEDTDRLEFLANAFLYGSSKYRDNRRCRIYQMARSSEKHFILIKNAIHVKAFMSNPNRVLNKVATAIVAEKQYRKELSLIKFNKVDYANSTEGAFNAICSNQLKKMKEVNEFISTYHTSFASASGWSRNFSNEIVAKQFEAEILEVVQTSGKIDTTVLDKAQEITDYFKDLGLIRFIEYREESLPLIVDYFKAKGKEVNEEWNLLDWQIKLIEESFNKLTYCIEVFNNDVASRSRVFMRKETFKSIDVMSTRKLELRPYYTHYYGTN